MELGQNRGQISFLLLILLLGLIMTSIILFYNFIDSERDKKYQTKNYKNIQYR